MDLLLNDAVITLGKEPASFSQTTIDSSSHKYRLLRAAMFLRILSPAIVVVIVVVLLATFAPAIAVGPDDGVWWVVQTNSTLDVSIANYTSVHQNGSNMLMGFYKSNGFWTYGVGVRSGNTIQGTSYTPNGQTYATWTVTISGNTISGSGIETGYPVTITAVRVF